jgi:hypothetical protein
MPHHRIMDNPILLKSLVDKSQKELSIDSGKIIEWECNAPAGCKGLWRESVKKRAQFTKCPKCEPARGRTAKVIEGSPSGKRSKELTNDERLNDNGIPKLVVKECDSPRRVESRSPRSSRKSPVSGLRSKSPSSKSPVSSRRVTSIEQFEKDAVKYAKSQMPFAESLLPLHRKHRAAREKVREMRKQLTKARESGATKAEMSAIQNKINKLVQPSAELSVEIDKAIINHSFGDAIEVKQPVVDTEKLAQEFIENLSQFSDEEESQEVVAQYNELMYVPTTEHMEKFVLSRNKETVINNLEYLNGEVTKEEWREKAIEIAKERYRYEIESMAKGELSAKLVRAIQEANRELLKPDVDADEAEEIMKQMGKKTKPARIAYNTAIREGNAIFDDGDYTILNRKYQFVPDEK